MTKHLKEYVSAAILLLCLLFIFFSPQGQPQRVDRQNNYAPTSYRQTAIQELKNKLKIPETEREHREPEKKEFVLPKSLVAIEEGAFEGTTAESISLPESLKQIGDHAFANIEGLSSVNIPASVSFIASDAFKGSDTVVISASSRYATAWARENGVPVTPMAGIYAQNHRVQVTELAGNSVKLQAVLIDEKLPDNKTKQTGRLTGELNASRFEGCSAFHIQGRAPPMG